ncbi:MAG: LysR family transcriptional regulator [Betaproteobacteria bacterium]|nr:LysR family transcriptional regulator [Betaproteobacteria bacterium]
MFPTQPLNFRNLDLNLLRVFDVVMAERSLTRAGRRLALTQPAISNALRRLRDTLHDELLTRQGQMLVPTPRAEALWPVIRTALQQLEQSLAPIGFEPSTDQSTFILTMADATASELMPGLSSWLETQAPGVSLRVVPLTTRDPRRLLRAETADLAVGHFPAVLADLTARAQSGEGVDFRHQRLFDGEYVCVMRRNHPLAREPLTLDAFCEARHLLVSFSGRPYGFVDEALASRGLQRRVVMTVNQFATAGRVVAQSNMLTVLPRHFVRVAGMGDALALRELPLDVPLVHIDMLWSAHRPPSDALTWLRDAIARAAQEAQDRHGPRVHTEGVNASRNADPH